MRLIRVFALGLAALGATKGQAHATDLVIEAVPVDIAPGTLKGLHLRGTHVLSADSPDFGGFSGLILRDGALIAVSDSGWWLEAPLVDSPQGLTPGPAQFQPLTENGAPLDKSGGDAEALAEIEGQIWIAFERDHRVMAHGGEGRLKNMVQDRRFEALGSNKGLEALAPLPGGGLLAIAEAPNGGGHPAFLIHDGTITEAQLPAHDPFYVTGADTGPDGRLYVLLRHFSPLTGVQIEIHRFALGSSGLPDASSREVLAHYPSRSGIDNMEGISLWRDAEGRLRLTLISDDNFNLIQRTLLMDFEVIE